MEIRDLVVKVFTAAVMLLISMVLQAETYYFHNDQLGTPQTVTDNTKQVVWEGEYAPFGKVAETVSTVEQNIRFPGQYYDQESGLHYNYFRTYNPNTGRFIQSDPVGLIGGLSTYGYGLQSPVVNTDPKGLNTAAGCAIGAPFAGPIGCGIGAAVGTTIMAGVILMTPGDTGQYSRVEDELTEQCDVLNDPETHESALVPPPVNKKRHWTAICKVVNQSPDPTASGLSAGFGWGVGSNARAARRAAEKMAKDTLGSKNVHHPSCKCTSPKGKTSAC